jgi:hypothetical protein
MRVTHYRVGEWLSEPLPADDDGSAEPTDD